MNKKQKIQNDRQTEEIDLGAVAKYILSKAHILLISGLVVAVCVYFAVTLFVTPMYKSRTSFYVYNRSDSMLQSNAVSASDVQASQNLTTTYAEMLSSNSVLNAVIDELDTKGKLSKGQLKGMVSAQAVDETQLLEVIVTSSDPEFACEIANAFAKVVPTEIVRITKAGGVEVVDQPEVATTKSSPQTTRDCMLGFVAGALVAVVVFVVRMLSDKTIYLPEDVENISDDITVLGQIPIIETRDDNYTQWTLTEGWTIRYETQEKQS